MSKNNIDKTYSWKNWIIKKLLTNDSTKEDILNYIANENKESDSTAINDNDEKNLIKNILKLNEKSVDDLMVPRSEIIAVDYYQSYYEILNVINCKIQNKEISFDKNKIQEHIKKLIE